MVKLYSDNHTYINKNEIKYPGGFSNQPSITKLAKAFDRFEHPLYIFDDVHKCDQRVTCITKKIGDKIMNNYEKINILANMARVHEPIIFCQDGHNLVGYIQDMEIRYGCEVTFTIETEPTRFGRAITITDVKLEAIRMPYFANRDFSIMLGRSNGKTASQALLNKIYGAQSESHLLPEIKNVNYQYKSGLTVVIWEDGTKTFVKCKNEIFDEEKALAMAIAKKAMGNEYKYFKKIKKWLPEVEKDD